MMKVPPLVKIILEVLETGWAFLDEKCRIVDYNGRFQKWQDHSQNLDKASISEVLPETVGLDTLFQELIAGEKKSFAFTHIEKDRSDREKEYFNLILLSTQQPEKPLLVLLLNDTAMATVVQKIQQQSYEIKLLNSLLHSKISVSSELIGISESMSRLKSRIEKIAKVPWSTVLIQGETGTGKSLVALMIHHLSSQQNHSFVEFNCAAVPETLLESELFGYEKGAFTHATTSKKGLLEEADNGTLFLDEIGDIPVNLQAKLLTALETRKFRRLGSTRMITSGFRLVAATNRDLKTLVENKVFREDLYYRLQVITLTCPPLREMKQDIILIAENFLQIYNREFGKNITGFTPEARDKLIQYVWPGNVRELRNVIERAMIFCEESTLSSDDIELHQMKQEAGADLFQLPENGLSFEALEKQLLKQALDRCDGNQSKAARLLNMSRDTFRYRLEKFNMLEA